MGTALVIGYGSVGKRHAKILSNLNNFDEVVILSKQKIRGYRSISSLNKIKDVNPVYIVIASVTKKHFEHLSFCEKNLTGKIIILEKPVFDKFRRLKITNNSVYIGYNLRFHPIIQKLKKEINKQNIININIHNSSFLPNWRLEQDYSKSSSAKKNKAGGVLLDISHELDFIQYLFGNYKIDYSFNDKISKLNIDTDDILILNGSLKNNYKNKTILQVHLNFFSKIVKRELFIDEDGKNIFADLIGSKLKIFYRNREKNILLRKNYTEIINKTFIDMHKAALAKNEKIICTYEQGLKVMRDIEKIRIKSKK